MNENEKNCPSTDQKPPVTTAPAGPDVIPAGTSHESIPDPRQKQPDQPMPAGTMLEITKIWFHGVTSSPQNSLTDREAVDEPHASIPQRVFAEQGAQGLDKLNFEVSLIPGSMDEKARLSYKVFFDRDRNPAPVSSGQLDIPSGPHPVIRERCEYIPDKSYLRSIGDHKVTVVLQLSNDQQAGATVTGNAKVWTEEFAKVGLAVEKTAIVTILD